MRTFDLINSEGETYTLTVANRYTGFLGLVEGLGYEKKPDYQQIGTEYEQLTDNINQPVISGVIQFFQPYAYRAFSRFALFCQDKKLTLYYRTPTGLFMKDGSITKVEKSEGSDSLKAKIEFTATSLWYQTFEETAEDDEILIVSDSLNESPCCLSFSGIEVNDSTLNWTQDLNDTEIMTGTLEGVTIATTDTVYVRTDTNPYQIYKVDSSDVKTDLYSKSNFATLRFPMIQKGENKFSVTGATEMTAKGRILYETV